MFAAGESALEGMGAAARAGRVSTRWIHLPLLRPCDEARPARQSSADADAL